MQKHTIDTIRHYGRFNAYGTWVFFKREVKRFLAIPTQTILAPMIDSVLFLSIFIISFENRSLYNGSIALADFLIPGFIMMKVIQNTFASSMTSLVSAKMNGAIVDMITPPLTAWEMAGAIMASCICRGIVVGVSAGLAMYSIHPYTIAHIVYATAILIVSAGILGTLGLLAGIWAHKWDEASAISTYFILPMSFLSGTFYSMTQLPETLQYMAYFNPFFYMIDGMRYAIIGISDVPPHHSLSILVILHISIFLVARYALASGWKLRP